MKRTAALKLEFSYRKDPDLCSIFLEEEEPITQICGAVWGDGTERGLNWCTSLFQLFAEEQGEGTSHLLYRDGFSTILHLLLGSPRPAAATLHDELCQAGPCQGLSLCESLPSQPVWALRVPSALGWEGI